MKLLKKTIVIIFQNKISTFTDQVDTYPKESSNTLASDIKGKLVSEVKDLKNMTQGDLKFFSKSKFGKMGGNVQEDSSPGVKVDQSGIPLFNLNIY